jgi:biotin carboxyl carrier protein
MVMISSPIEGIFQAGEISGGPALVNIGTTVTPETKLGSIQPEDATSMPILAGVTGTVKEILVKDQDMVMSGQALIKIEPMQMPKAPED